MTTRTIATPMLLGVLLLAVTASSNAQNQRDELELTRATIQNQRQQIVSMGLDLDEAESAAFWPVYRSYRAELVNLNDRTVAVIEEYIDNRETLSDEMAERLLTEYFRIEQAVLKVRTKYIKRFKKVLPVKKVTRFYQLENRLDVIVMYEVFGEVPLAE